MNNALALLRRFGQLEKRRTGTGLSVAELERWMTFKEALDRSTGAKKDRRSSFRVPTHLVCTFSVHDSAEGAVVTDLSRGGAFIRTGAPLPIGSKIELKLTIAGDEPIAVRGVVVSNHVDLDLAGADRGMGVRFEGMSPELAERIDFLYQAKLEAAGLEDYVS